MKKILKALFVISIILSLSSCEKKITTAGLTEKLVYFPEITLNGDTYIEIAQGVSFTDPGATASVNGQPVEVTMKVVGIYSGFSGTSVDVNKPDIYNVVYTAKNSDGFSISTNRTIFVMPTNESLTVGIQGVYTSTIYRSGALKFTDLYPVFIWKLDNGKYAISDAIGGYYDIGRVYGPTYAAMGLNITVNNLSANNFSFNDPIGVGKFGGALTITSMTVDAGTGKIDIQSNWDAGYTFEVILTQVQ